jgi:hypothetical protein
MEGPKGSAAADIDLEMEVTISGGGGREEPRQFLERRWKGEEVGWRRCFCEPVSLSLRLGGRAALDGLGQRRRTRWQRRRDVTEEPQSQHEEEREVSMPCGATH